MKYGPMGYGTPMAYPAPGYVPQAYGQPAYGPQGQGTYTYGPAQAPGYDAPRYPGPAAGQAPYRQSAGAASSSYASPQPAPRSATATQNGDSTVTVSGMRFTPATITVKPGDKVTWNFNDAVPHTVTARGGEFASNRLSAGGSYDHTFDQPGEYAYYCALHPSMVGKVVVKE